MSLNKSKYCSLNIFQMEKAGEEENQNNNNNDDKEEPKSNVILKSSIFEPRLLHINNSPENKSLHKPDPAPLSTTCSKPSNPPEPKRTGLQKSLNQGAGRKGWERSGGKKWDGNSSGSSSKSSSPEPESELLKVFAQLRGVKQPEA